LGWLGGGLRETLLATVAVELLTVPLVAVVFGRVPLLSPLANLLALPAVPVAMLTSLPVVASGLLPDWLAAPFAWVAWVPLAWIIAVVEACAAPSWAAIPLGRLSATLAWAYYTAAAALLLSAHAVSYRAAAPSPVALFRRAIGRVPAPFALGAALLGATVAWAGAFATSDGAARLTFFEGSGATLVQTGGGRVVVIDPGQSGRALAADLGRALPFYVRAIDLVILPRAGEAAAVPELLRRYQVGQIAAPTGEVGGSAREERWGIAAAEARVTVLAPPDGTRVALDEVTSLELIRAEETGAYAVRVAGPHGRVLLLGDGAMSAQRALADRLDGGADVLRLGPETAGALDGVLRERLDPRVAIVHVRSPTVGLAPRPLPRTDERMQVLRGDEHGTIELTLRSTGLQLRSRR
jgi:competence protein ComEC